MDLLKLFKHGGYMCDFLEKGLLSLSAKLVLRLITAGRYGECVTLKT